MCQHFRHNCGSRMSYTQTDYVLRQHFATPVDFTVEFTVRWAFWLLSRSLQAPNVLKLQDAMHQLQSQLQDSQVCGHSSRCSSTFRPTSLMLKSNQRCLCLEFEQYTCFAPLRAGRLPSGAKIHGSVFGALVAPERGRLGVPYGVAKGAGDTELSLLYCNIQLYKLPPICSEAFGSTQVRNFFPQQGLHVHINDKLV